MLATGDLLPSVVQRVSMYGRPAADGANVVLVCHALTGSSRAPDWWGGFIGPGAALDTDRLAVVCVNALGSCYGSTGPPRGPAGALPGSFPLVTIGDIVRAQRRALAMLGLERFAVVAGASLGGMLALEWATAHAQTVRRAIIIAAYDHIPAMGIAFNALARDAIRIARTPAEGIGLARKIAMLTYKSEALLAERFGRKPDRGGGDPYRFATDRFDVEGYLDLQAARFIARMEPGAYLTLTRAMDLFDIRERPVSPAMPRTIFVGISSDWLFLPRDVQAASERLRAAGADSVYRELLSDHGHDAFLAEPGALGALVSPLLDDLYAEAAVTIS